MLVSALVLFLVYALVTVGNWARCARGRSLVPLVGGGCGLAAGVLVDTPVLAAVLLLSDPGTVVALHKGMTRVLAAFDPSCVR